ncbi:exopolysaccharide production protein ExoQ [Mesorhizobium albiziae]|uniref:Exopolysaccharide production protein ExoQ n=1 Tax=Neomesorhizobium albiziae TaxID=335020 RepID=A0A1I3WEE2_9HYPH|nr:O-antigen ligase [Mesorhizobium albiziae]GLS31499.1 exopolysaccharide production protein ExoQ [Mesorhizobium albiziae]SFK04796.1 exopolysaccharide production protein ExoQ [Mesorhizobium albiziae]
MRIAKSLLVTPGQNFWFGIAAVAISIFVFAYSARFGQVSILAYYGLWLPLVLVNYRQVLGNYAKYWWILGFGLFACLSIFWSAAPGVTARASVQYFSHIVCALIVARTIDVRTLTLGALVGIMLVVVYSLLFGVYHYDPIDGSYSFVGAFSSKNQLGFYGSLGVYFAFAALFILHMRGQWRLLALGVGGLSGYAMFASQSATSIIATAVTLAASAGIAFVLMLAPRSRKMLFLVGLILLMLVVAGALNGGVIDLVLGAFGKDATLTGRTYLWSEGLRAVGNAPFVGVGYQAYWVQGFSEAERLWEEFYIPTRSGFHFHNTYIEALVELGYVGLVLLVVTMVGAIGGHLKRLLTERRNEESFLLLGIVLMLAVRSFFEVDVMNPYVVGSFLLYYSAGLLATKQPQPIPVPVFSRLEADFGKA